MVVILFNVYVYGNIITYRAIAPKQSAFMSMRMSEWARENREVSLQYRWLPYSEISVNLKKALIASEDAHFADHEGFDWKGIQQAMKRNQKSGKIKGGGSTISQQLAKNLFLNTGQNYVRKGEEALITAMMEATIDKNRIFELYLNVIEWDDGVFGAEAAAHRFYRKSARDLTKMQAAQMAARVPSPLLFAANPKHPRLYSRTNTILKRMNSAQLPE